MADGLVAALLLLALAAIAAVALAYARAIRTARKHLAGLNSQVLETEDGPIEYARRGEGFPVLVVHGALGGFDHGLWLARGFTLMDYQLISISRFGYLRSALPKNASLNLQADAYLHLLDALGLQQVALFAVSAGSTSAIRFAARHPERVAAMVLIGPDSPGEEQIPAPPRFVFDILLRSDLIYWLLVTFFGKRLRSMMGLVPSGYQLGPENKALIKQFFANILPVSERIDGLVYESYQAVPEFNESVTARSPYPLSGVRTPALIVHAEDDPLAIAENVQALARLLPNAQRYVVPDGGHLFFGHTQEVTAVILKFMRTILENKQPAASRPDSDRPKRRAADG